METGIPQNTMLSPAGFSSPDEYLGRPDFLNFAHRSNSDQLIENQQALPTGSKAPEVIDRPSRTRAGIEPPGACPRPRESSRASRPDTRGAKLSPCEQPQIGRVSNTNAIISRGRKPESNRHYLTLPPSWTFADRCRRVPEKPGWRRVLRAP